MPQPLKTPVFTPRDLTFGQGRNQTKFGFSPASFTENLTKFETEESVQVPSNFPHVISVEETEKVGYSFVSKEDDFVAGDIVLWDGEKKIVASQEGFSLPASGYTPIGVVVIPASHMEDNKARMMATRWMSCEDPENGSMEPENMVWGTATDLTGITNSGQVPVIAKYDDENAGGVTALTDPQKIYTASTYGFLSSDYPSYTGETNPEDEGTRWYRSNTRWADSGHTMVAAYNFYVPSPYAKDGTSNPLYRATEYSGGSISNILSNFDGRKQTDVILEARGERDYGSWKPTSSRSEDFPVVSVCDMYHTVGTSQGDWYIPSAGELGYIISRLNKISSALAKVGGLLRLPYFWAWSSSECDIANAGVTSFDSGTALTWNPKNRPPRENPVLAFAIV